MSRLDIIMYHYVRELPFTRYPQIKGLLLSQFVQQLDYLEAEGYSFISCRQIAEAFRGGRPLPEKGVLLTFDDGYLDHYTNVFPILRQRGIPAFFSMPGKILKEKKVLDVNKIHFLLASMPSGEIIPQLNAKMDYYRGSEFNYPSNDELYEEYAVANRFDDKDTIYIKRVLQHALPEKVRNLITDELFRDNVCSSEESFVSELYMSMDQIRLMASEGMEWGIHGYDHYWMNRLEGPQLEKDIEQALEVFDGVVPSDGWWCCYPYGSVSDEVITCTKRYGSGGGFTTVVGTVCPKTDNIYEIPRWDTNDFPPKSTRYLE